MRKPIASQDSDGKHKSIASGYRLLAGHRIAFTLGDYDRNRELVIDPLLVYSTLWVALEVVLFPLDRARVSDSAGQTQ